MKKHVMTAAIVSLVALGGCDAQQNGQATANVEMVADDIEARANALEAQALDATMPVEGSAMTNAADAATNMTASQSDSAR